MTLRPTSFGFVSLAIVLAACGDDGNADGSGGSESDTSADATMTDPSMTDPEASQSMSEPTTDPGSSDDAPTTDPDTTAGTTDDPDTGSTDDATTGEPACPYTPVDGTPALALQLVGSGFDRPVLAIGHPDQPDRLYVVEQGGDIKILEPGEDMAPDEVFLHVDVAGANNVTTGDERGLLGFAFHPGFPDDPRVYVAYNAADGGQSPALTVSEFLLMRGDDSQADPTTERIVIDVDDPASNHNGGMIGFGPDGYMYIGLGDGGGFNNTYLTGRDPSVILAKMLRIDPEPDGTDDNPEICGSCGQLGPFDYTIPDDNPFVGDDNFAPEIYAWGFRNPWRWSFDIETGDLWVGDVGQGEWEEVDIVSPGLDYGWSDMEGNHCFDDFGCDESAAPNTPNGDDIIAPVTEYSHSGDRCSITGGTVYRSCEVPGWSGVYTFADYCTGEMFALTWDGTTVQDEGLVLALPGEVIMGHGWNAWGDSYFTTVEGQAGGVFGDGHVYRLAPE
jgi:glucose/arabinose dehydrogenase